MAAKIAEMMEVSLDFLTGISDQEMDREIIKQVNDIQSLNNEDKQHILKTLQSLVRDAKARQAYS